MTNVISILNQAKKELEQNLDHVNKAISALNGDHKKRVMSAAGRKRIADAQRARWKKLRKAA